MPKVTAWKRLTGDRRHEKSNEARFTSRTGSARTIEPRREVRFGGVWTTNNRGDGVRERLNTGPQVLPWILMLKVMPRNLSHGEVYREAARSTTEMVTNCRKRSSAFRRVLRFPRSISQHVQVLLCFFLRFDAATWHLWAT